MVMSSSTMSPGRGGTVSQCAFSAPTPRAYPGWTTRPSASREDRPPPARLEGVSLPAAAGRVRRRTVWSVVGPRKESSLSDLDLEQYRRRAEEFVGALDTWSTTRTSPAASRGATLLRSSTATPNCSRARPSTGSRSCTPWPSTTRSCASPTCSPSPSTASWASRPSTSATRSPTPRARPRSPWTARSSACARPAWRRATSRTGAPGPHPGGAPRRHRRAAQPIV